MRRVILILSLTALIACNNSKDSNSSTEKASEAKTDDAAAKPTDPEAERGLQLVAKSDCFTCHKVDEQSTGPAYTAVAAKYPKNDEVLDSLSKKIIGGGAGNWGTVPMIPHPSISPEDAKAMVAYVLSLKK